MSSTVVNEFRFGYNYFFNTFGRELANERDVVKELDIPGLIGFLRRKPGAFRRSAITGFSGFGDNTEGPYTNRNHALEFNDNVSWIRGRHSLKVGGSLRYDMYNQVGNQFARGNFQFQQHRHRLRVRRLHARLHAAERSRGGAGGHASSAPLSQSYYFTDTWKVRSNMTFDLGLRYEYTPPWFDANGTLMNASIPCHDTTPNVADLRAIRCWCASAAATCIRTPCSASRRTFRSRATAGLAISLIDDDKKNFAPRVGWA